MYIHLKMKGNMKKYIATIGIGLLVAAAGIQEAAAQKMTRVSGTVYNIAGKKRVPFTDVTVSVYATKTVAEGKDLVELLNSENEDKYLELDREAHTQTDANGYYEVMVPDNGALVFKVGLNPAVLEEVKQRMKIDKEFDDGMHLKSVVVTGVRTLLNPEPKAPRMTGNLFMPYNTFNIPPHMGNTFSRLIIQPYVLDCQTNDTVAFGRPVVIDGKEYGMTQERKLGWDMDRDPLKPYILKDEYLSKQSINVEWADTIIVPDPDRSYSCFATVSIEDYAAVVYRTFKINTCQTKRPLQFLQMNLAATEMNLADHKEKAQIEKRNTADKVTLSFKINTAELEDTQDNKEKLDMLKKKLTDIAESPGSVLKEFHVTGTASPDGNADVNLRLAENRLKKIEREITSVLPEYILERVYRNPQARVAEWGEVAELMRKDGKNEQAEQIEQTISACKDKNRLGLEMKKLDFYQSEITEYLKQLRAVNYNCIYEVYREPNEKEIMVLYKQKGIDGDYTRYEYWRLFELVKDEHERELLYKKAYQQSLEEERPWALAGNNLAAAYLKRDTTDTSILEPLIDRTVHITDYERASDDNARKTLINPSEVVSNQLCMYIKQGDFENASILAKMLPDDSKYDLMKAYAWAMGGYYHGGRTAEEKERAEKTFNTIKNSSPQNEVVMYLALETREGDRMAEEAVKKLPEDKALTQYFMAIIENRKGEVGFMNAATRLVKCFKLDKSFVAKAQNDGEFSEDLVMTAMDMCNF